MKNANLSSWMAWQKEVIKSEYKDIKPFRDSAQRQVDKAVKSSLVKVKRNVD
jgi:hypothetical protein